MAGLFRFHQLQAKRAIQRWRHTTQPKAGLIGFVKGVAKEVAVDGITINALAPAVIATPINANTAKETLAYMISKIPAGRLGEPSEVAEIIAFMGSKACSFTTGFTFDISGGRATY